MIALTLFDLNLLLFNQLGPKFLTQTDHQVFGTARSLLLHNKCNKIELFNAQTLSRINFLCDASFKAFRKTSYLSVLKSYISEYSFSIWSSTP